MKPKRIESITLKDIGVFKDVTIEFPIVPVEGKAEVHIFTGMNGSGKTTLLEGLLSLFKQKINLTSKLNTDDSRVQIAFAKEDFTFVKDISSLKNQDLVSLMRDIAKQQYLSLIHI